MVQLFSIVAMFIMFRGEDKPKDGFLQDSDEPLPLLYRIGIAMKQYGGQ
jgi:hypothetical protein